MSNIKTWVCVDDEHIYEATVDLSHRWNGWLSPGFTLDAVRQLAAHTEEMAEAEGFDCSDQIIVIDGEPEPVVLHVRWQYHKEEGAQAVNVVKPDENGLYWIGGWEWCWYQVEDGPLFYTANATFDAWQRVLGQSARRIGEILRTQMPEATSCLVDLTSLGHIVQVDGDSSTWPSNTDSDGPDGYGPFDSETLGEADEVLRKALDHGRDRVSLELGGWRPARDIRQPELHRIVFAPAGHPHGGDALLDEARAAFTEARRTWLTESAPYLVNDARAACPQAIGVVVDPTASEPFVMFLADNDDPTTAVPVLADLAEKVTERLEAMFTYRPTGEDLTAAGWSSSAPARLDGAYHLLFHEA
ncbi:hypothetical protein AB0A05_07405 [Streptomyces sp. NPDC046374]|uniref:hypothetical protein n=1 Tax=Streptomyces sp. NPDC046374 TaxID=3154917 RepID=UPI0033D8A176